MHDGQAVETRGARSPANSCSAATVSRRQHMRRRKKNDRYTQLFTNILNYGTLPFYWGRYQPQQYRYNEPEIANQVKWTKDHGLKEQGPSRWSGTRLCRPG